MGAENALASPSRRNMRGGRKITVRAQKLRRETTDAERKLWWALRYEQTGWRFRRQFPIPPYIVDFACVEARLVVEADGGQHADADEDVVRDAFLRREGWRVLRFWNNDILQNRQGVVETILNELCGSPPETPPPAGR